MLFQKKKDSDPSVFWKEYEEKIQEKVLAKALGRYISGWAEYGEPLWGLVIATTGGFRFHHFPHEGWLIALTRISTGGEPPREKTIFISRERITGVSLRVERSWWKRLLMPSPPVLCVRYSGIEGGENELFVEGDWAVKEVIAALDGILSGRIAETAPA